MNIIEELCYYYDILLSRNKVTSFGFSKISICFLIVLDNLGNFLRIEDIGTKNKTKTIGKLLTAPSKVLKGNGINANLLWDKIEYIFPKNDNFKKVNVFVDKINEYFPNTNINDISVILKFLNFIIKNKKTEAETKQLDDWRNKIKYKEIKTSNISFKIEDNENNNACIFDNNNIINIIKNYKRISNEGICMFSNSKDDLTELHPKIENIPCARSTGAVLIQFNTECSRLNQCNTNDKKYLNAPISEEITHKYSTILNYLINSKETENQRIKIGNIIILFWIENKGENILNEDNLFKLFKECSDNYQDNEMFKNKFESIFNGKISHDLNSDIKFNILGLQGNGARIFPKFFYKKTISEFFENIDNFFNNSDLENNQNFKKYYSIMEFIRSLLTNQEFKDYYNLKEEPKNIYNSLFDYVINGKEISNHIKELIIKRSLKITKNYENLYKRSLLIKIIFGGKMSLDLNELNVGYLLGRFMAICEKISKDAYPEHAKTLKDKYENLILRQPVLIADIQKSINTYLGKIGKNNFGKKVYYEKIIGEIIGKIKNNGLNVKLSTIDKANYMIGGYHQTTDLYTKK